MVDVRLRMSDNAFHYLSGIINYMDDVSVVDESDEFSIDVNHCLDALSQIKKGNTKDFKETTPKKLMKDIEKTMELL